MEWSVEVIMSEKSDEWSVEVFERFLEFWPTVGHVQPLFESGL